MMHKRWFTAAVLVLAAWIIGSASTPESVPLGVVMTRDSSWGRMALEGLRLAVKEINRHGGFLGRPLELIIKDDEGRPQRSADVTAQLAEHSDIRVLFGSSTSEVTLPMVPVVEKARKILITPYIGHHAVTENTRYVFRPVMNTRAQGEAMARFGIERLKLKRVLVLKDVSSRYSRDLCDIFAATWKRLGGEVAGVLSYDVSTVDFRPFFRAFAGSSPPDAVYLPGHDADTVRIVLTLDKMGVRTIMLGAATWDSESIYTHTGARFHHGFYPSTYHPSIPTLRNKMFLKKFRKEYGHDPAAPTVAWYDALMILDRAVKKAGSLEVEPLRKAMLQTDYYGPSGRIRFRPNGDALREMIVIEIRDGVRSFYASLHAEDSAVGPSGKKSVAGRSPVAETGFEPLPPGRIAEDPG